MTTHDQSRDVLFMRRAMELADRGRGSVSPNPMVGCVIVHDGRIVGEGWHQRYGEAHAEVNAVHSVLNQKLLRQCTMYVTLEPCSHFGKTPPCADMIVRAGIKRVVLSNEDPNPLVAGKGIEKLRAAGIDVQTGVMQREGLELNRRFFTMIQKQRPYIILKWAQTEDGFMARENGDSKWISNVYSRQLTHKWRTEEDAILVGTRTALHDNPRLTTRDWTGRHALRIVIDRQLKLPSDLRLFDGTSHTLRFNEVANETTTSETRIKIEDHDFLSGMIKELHIRKVQSVIVEGGPTTLESFVNRGLWDEVRIFIAPSRFGKGLRAPQPTGSATEIGINGDRLITIRPFQHF